MLGLLLPPANASARPAMAPTYTFTVNDEGWGTDTHPGDGICATAAGTCTLYAAISEANASSGNDLIVFDASVDEIWFGTSVAIRGDEGITIQGNQQVTLRWGGASDPFSQSQMIHIESDHNILQGLRMDGEGLIGSCVKITGNHNLLGVNINEATNHYLEQNTFEHSHYGVRITGDNNQLTGNTLKYNEWSGITLSQGAGNIIGSYAGLFGYNYQYNYIYGNEKFGIAVIDSTDTLIAGNYVGTEGETDQDVGIIVRELGSLDNTIYSNVIHHHNNGNPHATSGVCGALENVDSGIEVCEASGTVIVGNTIISNTVGVYVWGGAAQTRIGSDGSGDAQDTRNLISNNDVGVRIVDATTEHTVVAGNYIGTDATGTTAWPNEDGVIIDAAINTRIGGTTTLERNLISGNLSHGIEFKNAASQSIIVNNYIGTTITGTAALPNQETGLLISGSGNRVGGTTPGEGNLISGNGKYGIQILGDANEAYSNTIGLDSAGTGALGNGKAGIYISGSDNVIGTTTGSPNQIAHNAEQGVWVESGTGNSLRGNTIVDNGELGIDLAPEGVTPNDAGDADPGSNNLQNYPDLSLVISSGGNTRILGTLNSTPVTTFDIDFYASDSCDAYGYGEGQTYVGTTSVATNDQGEASFYVTLPQVPVGQAVVATATDPNGSTSEFSQCSLAVASPPAAGAYEVNSTADVVDDDTGDATCDTGNTVGSDPECTLRAAIQQANASPGADLIIVPAGIYPITITGNDNAAAMGDFDITDDVNIVGAGAAATVIDGGGMERVFHMDPSDAGIHVNLSGVTVQGGSSTGGGAGIHNRGALTLTQSVVRYNQESLNGGGLYNGIYGVLHLIDSTIYSNTANTGAGLYTWGLVTATNTTFSQNEAESSGGGIYVDYGQTWLYNVTLTENVADSDNDGGDGGGIVADSGVTVTVQNSILAGNYDNSHNDYPYGYPDCVGTFVSGGYNHIGPGLFGHLHP